MKDAVAVGGTDEHGARRNHRATSANSQRYKFTGNMQSQWPSTVRSHTWEAKRGGTANRRYHLHAFVGSSHPPTHRAAPGNAGDPQARAVHFRQRRQQVETAHAVPEFYTGGRGSLG